VNIVVLRVMTLTIVIHCVQNFVSTNVSTINMIKAKGGMEETMMLKPRA
jgi:hypothetical protein